MAEPVASAPEAAAGPVPTAPLFYKRPIALSPALHFGISLVGSGDYGFARATNSIPLNANEFSLAVRHYPIVFTASAPSIPVAVVGSSETRNLFVDRAGRWAEGVYIPAYVRRYPFLFFENPKEKQFVLGVDDAAPLLKESAQNRLFLNGKPTPVIERAMAFCSEYQTNIAITRDFCKAVEDEGLLSDKEAVITLADGRQSRLTGFRVIEEKSFDKLPSKTFLRWRRRGWLHPIYLHLVSIANWAQLVDRAAKQEN